ncbi:MAG: DNA/RNA non-specific endonuclease [Ferruginibacter sp.]|nr:DNA/RNA non-specific endonuclease [Ferruginibacter sp.]
METTIMKNKFTLLFLSAIIFFSSCKKDAILTTPAPQPPIVVPPVAPPTDATDSTLLLGNPSSATDNEADFGNYLMKEGYYSLSYNRDRGTPNWVSWHVVYTDFGSFARQNDFRANPNLPETWYKVAATSYSASGFDRGHVCPSSDRTSTLEANSATFLMTNIIPQAPNNNQGPWASLETYCRSLVQAGNELYVIAGVYGEGGVGNSGAATTVDNGKVTVPSNLWKVIVVLPDGANDLSRVKNNSRVISVIMPNINTISTDWRSFRTSVDYIEDQTGYDVLSKVSTSIQNVIEAKVDDL